MGIEITSSGVKITDANGGSISISQGSVTLRGPGGGSVSLPVDEDGVVRLTVPLPRNGSASLTLTPTGDGGYEFGELRATSPEIIVGSRAIGLGFQGFVSYSPDTGLVLGGEYGPKIFGRDPQEIADKVYDIVTDSSIGRALSTADEYNDYVMDEMTQGRQPLKRFQWLALQRKNGKLERSESERKDTVTWRPSHDPLALDLDGDGLETLGESDSRLFDHTGSNLVNGTGWLSGDDGFLVYDRDGNGVIDNGGELFGVDTVMSNGRKANSGFEALADLDSNADGVINASDAAFSSLRVWQDSDEDAVTDAGELKSLAELNIASINLNPTGGTVALGNGNTVSGSATFSYQNGSTGNAYNLNLLVNAYQRQYKDNLPIPEAMEDLPNMAGTGRVRDLIQAAVRDENLADTLRSFSEATTRDQQMALLSDLVNSWASTSDMKTSVEEAQGRRYRQFSQGTILLYEVPGIPVVTPAMAGLEHSFTSAGAGSDGSTASQANDTFYELMYDQNPAYRAWLAKLAVIEKFSGQTLINLPQVSSEPITYTVKVKDGGSGSTVASFPFPYDFIRVGLSEPQKASLEQSYAYLLEGVYASLVVQTRLKPYTDAVIVDLSGEKMALDYSETNALFEQKKQSDEVNAYIDLVELNRYGGQNLYGQNWDGADLLRGWLQGPLSAGVQSAMATLHVSTLLGSQDAGETHDFLFAGLAGSTINAGDGDDNVIGDAGADTLRGNEGDDLILGGAGNDVLFGGAGSDLVMGGDGNDYVAGSDFGVYSGDGDDTLYGGAGNDHLTGAEGNDTLVGGTGNDDLLGGNDDDTYFFEAGDGNDTIVNSQQYGANNGVDTIRFGASVSKSDIILSRNSDDLTFTNQLTSDSITVYSQFGGEGHSLYSIDFVEFDDGTRWTADDLKAIYLAQHQTQENDTVVAFSAAETLHMGDGNDTVYSVGGDDIVYGETGNDVLYGGDGNDSLYGGSGHDSLLGDAGNDLLVGGEGNDGLRGGDGDDIIDGGAGDDYLNGLNGDDTYVFRLGDGHDTIENSADYNWGNGIDVIRYEAGINVSDILVKRSGESLILENSVSGDSISVYGHFSNDGQDRYSIDFFEFADGTRWSASDLNALYLAQSQTAGNDYIKAFASADVLNMAGGNDTVYAGDGNDVVHGGQGNDSLYGEAGNNSLYGDEGHDYLAGGADNDLLVGGEGNDGLSGGGGNDTLEGEAGADSLNGGDGDDILNGGAGDDDLLGLNGDDTYVFDLGHGHDRIINSTDYNWGNGVDTIRFEAGINPGDIRVQRDSRSLYLTNVVTGDSIEVVDHFTYGFDGRLSIDFVEFADGTRWSAVDINNLYIVHSQTSGNDSITGFSSADVISTQGGNDYVWAGEGNDTIDGGAGDDQLYGQDGDDVLIGGDGLDYLEGGAGNDIYVVGTDDIVVESAGGGIDTVQSNITWTLAATDNVENLTLTGTSDINGTGNALDNVLIGNSGANVLAGGAGNDTYYVSTGDTVTEAASAGTDTVISDITWSLASTTNIENLTLTGTAAINATGNALANVLIGNAGNNTLNGGSGADTLQGGLGNDTYTVDNIGDTVVELSGEGSADVVNASVSYTLSANVERITLTGSGSVNATGNALDNQLTGNSGANILTGGAGNDTYIVGTGDTVVENADEGLDTVLSGVTWTLASTVNIENLTLTGSGNVNATGNVLDNVLTGNGGANILTGGAGNDTYVVGAGDTVVENADEGLDTVQSSITWTLASTDNVENLTLTGTGAVNATGNALDNLLTGNSGANILTGSAGNDTYVVGTGDTVVENADEGIDTVRSSISWTLASSANVENLTLTGTGAVNATGNALDNVLAGNSGANILTGGAGNDTYVVSAGDTVVENADEGIDTVRSSVSWSLASSANIENLTLTGTAGISGTGNALDNILVGNSVANTLAGGAGNDTYYVSTGDKVTEAAGAGIDTVISDITWTLASTTNIENLTLIGTADINATGNTLANVLRGNAGNNILTGAAGNDTYLFGLGGAADTIVDSDSTSGNADKLLFDAGTAYDQLWFTHTGSNLEISIIGTADKVTISNWYGGASKHVERIEVADGHYLSDGNVEALVQAMAGMTPPALGQTSLTTAQHQQLDTVLASSWAA